VKLNQSLFQSQDNQQDFLQKGGKGGEKGEERKKKRDIGTAFSKFQPLTPILSAYFENLRINSDIAVSLVSKPNPTEVL